MKQKIKKWTFRILITSLFAIVVFIIFVLNPTLLYANKTRFGNFIVYHNSYLDSNFKTTLTNATRLLESSEIYNAKVKIDICLNDGSFYPTLVQTFHPPAFGIGFYNIVVLMGNINWKDNYEEYNGIKWNLTQLITHETLHCLQFTKFGLFKSNPVAGYPAWKWEGYNEYVARQNNDQVVLAANIARLNKATSKPTDEWGIRFADSTYVGRYYYEWWVLMQYCKDIKKMSYPQILQDSTAEETLRKEMMKWYEEKQ